MDYIKAILEAGNSDFSNVVKSSIFLTVYLKLYKNYFNRISMITEKLMKFI